MVFSGLVIKDMDMISALFELDREWLEQSVVIQEWKRQLEKEIEVARKSGFETGFDEGFKLGLNEGFLLGWRENILTVLEARFGVIGTEMEDPIYRIEDLQRLRDLHDRALVVPSLEKFAQDLQG